MRKFLMTWVEARKGWMKAYKGKQYAVSCKQLGAPPTKSESYLAANDWWTARESLLETKQPATAEQVRSMLHQFSKEELYDMMFKGARAADILDLQTHPIEAMTEAENSDGSIGFLVSTLKPSPTDDTKQLDHWRTKWLETLTTLAKGKGISYARVNSYRRHIAEFVNWYGAGKSIAGITNETLVGWWTEITSRMNTGRWSSNYASGSLMTLKQFIKWLAENAGIPLPGNINNKRIKIKITIEEIVTFTTKEIKVLLDASSDRDRLFWLLMLNCGFQQSDISDLTSSELDLKKGTITRYRSKRAGKADAQKVTYPLWEETIELLKKYGNKEGRVLLTQRGEPLVKYGDDESRYDTINSAWIRLQRKTGIEKPLKCFRKTSATMLGEHKNYKFYHDFFLAHSPKSVSEKSYMVPSAKEFAEAVEWLRKRLLEGN